MTAVTGTLHIKGNSVRVIKGASGIFPPLGVVVIFAKQRGGMNIRMSIHVDHRNASSLHMAPFQSVEIPSRIQIDIHGIGTILATADNKIIIIPNGKLSNDMIINYSKGGIRRVDWLFNITYGDNYDKAREILTQFINEDKRITPSSLN